MSEDTKALLKSTTSNIVTILGCLSTAVTFIPGMVVERPYLRPLGIVLIIVGIFRGAQSVILAKNVQLEQALFLEDQRQANLRRKAEDKE